MVEFCECLVIILINVAYTCIYIHTHIYVCVCFSFLNFSRKYISFCFLVHLGNDTSLQGFTQIEENNYFENLSYK